jgi:hypothetical protein
MGANRAIMTWITRACHAVSRATDKFDDMLLSPRYLLYQQVVLDTIVSVACEQAFPKKLQTRKPYPHMLIVFFLFLEAGLRGVAIVVVLHEQSSSQRRTHGQQNTATGSSGVGAFP